MRVSILIPILNERAQLRAFCDRLFSVAFPIETEFIFIDDGSRDGSLEFLNSEVRRPDVRVFSNGQNFGKGYSIRRGIQAATGDFVAIQDADFEYNPHDLVDLLQPLIQGRADVVFGSRFQKGSFQVHRTYHYFVNRILTLLSNLFSGIYLSDMETCYKIFRRELIQAMNLRSNRFGVEVELTAYLAKTRARIEEHPISYRPRTRLQGKKIGWKDGFAALFHLIRFNWFVSIHEAFRHLPEFYAPEGMERAASKPTEHERVPDIV